MFNQSPQEICSNYIEKNLPNKLKEELTKYQNPQYDQMKINLAIKAIENKNSDCLSAILSAITVNIQNANFWLQQMINKAKLYNAEACSNILRKYEFSHADLMVYWSWMTLHSINSRVEELKRDPFKFACAKDATDKIRSENQTENTKQKII